MIRTSLLCIIICLFFSCSENEKNNIEGKWVIKNIEIDNFSLPDNCKNITIGDTLNFKNEGLEVLKKNIKCSDYRYIFRGQNLELLISDMSISMKVISLNSSELKIRSKSLPKEMMINWKEEYLKYKKEGFLITLKRD